MSDTTTTTSLDIQDPLPEANWLWRRIFVFIAMMFAFAILFGLAIAVNRIVGNVVGRIDTMSAVAVAEITKQALVTILTMYKLTFYTLMVIVTYYMVAPSAEQIVKLLQTAGLLKAGVQIATRTIETPNRTETASTVAAPPAPTVPPIVASDAQERPVQPVSGEKGTDEAPTLPAPSPGLDLDAIMKGS